MSALTNLRGLTRLATDPLRMDANTPAFLTTGLIDAGTERWAAIGRVWHPTVKTGTINIRKVYFRLGAVTFNVLSTLRVSLQDISATGPPYQPGGTILGAGNAGFADMTTLTANVVNVTGSLGADVAVDLSVDSIGDTDSPWLAVVLEYATFTALDSIVVSSNQAGGNPAYGMGRSSLLYTGSWATLAGSPIVYFECSDGSLAFLDECMPVEAYGTVSVTSTGAIRRAGVYFQVSVELKIDRMALLLNIANGSDGTLTLYDSDGTTVLRSMDVDNDQVTVQGSPYMFQAVFEPVTLSANTNYRFAFVATVATGTSVYYVDVDAAAAMDGMLLGQTAHWTEYDGAAWAQTTTRRPQFGIGIAAVHDGAGGGGGGMMFIPNLSGT